MFVPYDLFIQIGHTVFSTHPVMDCADDPLELSPELFDSIRMYPILLSFSIPTSFSELSFRMVRGSVMVMDSSNGV